jgi:hypothetical protein
MLLPEFAMVVVQTPGSGGVFDAINPVLATVILQAVDKTMVCVPVAAHIQLSGGENSVTNDAVVTVILRAVSKTTVNVPAAAQIRRNDGRENVVTNLASAVVILPAVDKTTVCVPAAAQIRRNGGENNVIKFVKVIVMSEAVDKTMVSVLVAVLKVNGGVSTPLRLSMLGL